MVWLCRWIFIALGLGLLHGCVPAVPTSSKDEDGRSGNSVVWPLDGLGEVEPNSTFDAAMPAAFADAVRLAGRIDSHEDPDLYALGALGQGTRIQCTVESPEGVETVFCLFDEQERLLARSTVIAPDRPRTFTLLLPEPVENLFLLASGAEECPSHAYSADLSRVWGDDVLAYRPQVVLLNFRGAQNVTVAGRAFETIPPFDAASISSQYAGQTEAIIHLTLALVRADYQGLGVSVYLVSDPLIPPGPFSVVHFGAENPDLLGVADGVDPFNGEVAESAIVYTDTFALFASLEPDAAEMAQILANVTSHELGHLLGLRHTGDHDDLMDVTATARRLLSDQWFKKARLHASVSPLGYQDGPTMLAWAVGGKLVPPPDTSKTVRVVVDDPRDFDIPRSMLCGHCSVESDG